jgi:hypothetical protein
MPGEDIISFRRVQAYLNAIADAHGAIQSSPHRRFWNVAYLDFVDDQVPNVACNNQPVAIINRRSPFESPFFLILQGQWCDLPQMPRGGPYITEPNFEVDLPDGTAVTGPEILADLTSWLTNGYPEHAPD